MSENYTSLELIVLILSYIFLSFTVGCISTLSLKEYFSIYSGVYLKSYKKGNLNGNWEFYFLSGLSTIFIMLINRKIFKSFEDITSNWILMSIIIVCFSSFVISLFFHFLFLIPVEDKEKKKSKKIIENNNDNKKEKDDEININKIENNNEEDKKEKLKVIKMRDLRVKDKQNEIKINSIKNINEEQIIRETAKNNKRIDIISRSDSEDIAIKINQSFPYDENKIKEVEVKDISINKKKSKKKLDSTKICTLCGYIYIEKKIGNKKTCVCYYYTNKCKWLREKLIRFDVIAPLITELYCQISIVGYNSILTEKLLNVYPYSKIMKFYGAFFVLSLFVPVFVVYDINKKIKKRKNTLQVIFFQ